MSKIFIVVAHPDDEVLGCGGTIAKYAKEGSKVYCLFLGRGKSSRGVNGPVLKKQQAVLMQEARKAAEILGISKTFFEDFPDQQYDSVPILKIIQAVEKIKNRIKPNIVFTHHAGDLNIDHHITFKAVLTACRPLKEESVKKIYSFEVPSSTEWGAPKRKDYFIPNVFVDISETFNKKIKALGAYKSEERAYPHPRSGMAVEVIAKRWGLVVGKELVEAFELIRKIDSQP